MDSALAQYLLESTHKVFEESFDITIHEIANPPKEALLYSQIGITDDTQTKEIIIGMPKKGLVFLNGIYFGLENAFSDEEIEDFIKELSNLIVGKVKVIFSENNKKTKLEIPKIITLKSLNNYIIKYLKVKDTYLMLIY